MLELIKHPWHWAVAGVLIGLTVPILLLIGNKKFGISSSLRHVCAMCLPANIPFFKYDWKKEIWNLFFVVGILLGGIMATQFLSNPNAIVVADSTKASLSSLGITDFTKLMPSDIFSVEYVFTLKGLYFFVIGGFLVGFGTRYAGGCTSGHAIMGLSNLQVPSLIATCCFMAGGFFSANILLPIILKLF
ncbi:MAG: YeeE/YedE family protein [Pseudarcicella sp.]|nr:YeeE/YedE family protein [Pseudarcicella sp.]MBP6411653.1 YeeE/YedE family protein [Pseudarcicella sp.]